MADNLRHAAGHTTYEVHEVLEDNPAADLGIRFSSHDFAEAIELALDFLESEDPERNKVSALQIVRVQGDRHDVVWSYSHSLAPASRDDLIRLWGFDPTRPWNVPSSLRR
jgi:hypothetical protein